MWQEDKKKEMQERKLVQSLYRDLVGKAKLNELSKKVHGNLNVLILRLENVSKIFLIHCRIYSIFFIFIYRQILQKRSQSG